MKLFYLLPVIGLLLSCNSNDDKNRKPAAAASNYFSFAGSREYNIGDKDKTIILDFVASGGTPNIRYNIDKGPWYKIADDNCTAFRVHVVIEKGRTCNIANDTDLYVSGHYERTAP